MTARTGNTAPAIRIAPKRKPEIALRELTSCMRQNRCKAAEKRANIHRTTTDYLGGFSNLNLARNFNPKEITITIKIEIKIGSGCPRK
jgi:hypothetical protein